MVYFEGDNISFSLLRCNLPYQLTTSPLVPKRSWDPHIPPLMPAVGHIIFKVKFIFSCSPSNSGLSRPENGVLCNQGLSFAIDTVKGQLFKFMTYNHKECAGIFRNKNTKNYTNGKHSSRAHN